MKRLYSTSSIFSGPAVKHLFLQYPNINPTLIKSTGKNGRITKSDFLSYLEKNPNGGSSNVGNVNSEVKKENKTKDVSNSSTVIIKNGKTD